MCNVLQFNSLQTLPSSNRDTLIHVCNKHGRSGAWQLRRHTHKLQCLPVQRDARSTGQHACMQPATCNLPSHTVKPAKQGWHTLGAAVALPQQGNPCLGRFAQEAHSHDSLRLFGKPKLLIEGHDIGFCVQGYCGYAIVHQLVC
jgi:hypothetical protein